MNAVATAQDKRPYRLIWVRAIFCLHLTVVCLFIPLIWRHAAGYHYFPFLYLQLDLVGQIAACLILGTPLAIAFVGFVTHIPARIWLPYVILDILIGQIHSIWMSFLIPS